MMKQIRLIPAFALLFVGLNSYGQAPPAATPAVEAPPTIEWLSWTEAMERMEQDSVKKKVFIDIYTDWCGWCKKMDRSTFMDPNVVNAMNEGYYAVKLDAEMVETVEYNKHQFINPKPNAKRSVHQLAGSLLDWQMSYPSYVMLDERRNRISIFKGYKQVPDMYSILQFFGRNHYQHHNNFLYKQWDAQQKARQQQQVQQAATGATLQQEKPLQD